MVPKTHWQGEGQRVKREEKETMTQVNELEVAKD